MDGPLSIVLNFSHATEMMVSVLVGIGFGVSLEKAGFGRADNLASIFYARDFRVLRVMFSAIVTGMIGLYFLDLTGILPIYSIGLLDTYLLPQLLGGLLLGAGFIIGGYCPGTSIVATASGKLDAVFFLGGLFLGTMAFTLGYGNLQAFHTANPMGRVLLHEFFGVPAGVMVFAVALMAVGMFWGAGRLETFVNARFFSKEG